MAFIVLTTPGMDYLLLFISVIYSITFFTILVGFFKNRQPTENPNQPTIQVSVIIAARNEEINLPILLHDLKRQTYPANLFDIIIADDHSDQRVSSLIEANKLDATNLTVVELPEFLNGKKAALRLAVEKSESELLLFTDADCKIGRDWVRSFALKYQKYYPELILGMVDYPVHQGFINAFFRHEFISLIISGIGTANLGYPTICNGANLAVKREDYLEASEQLKMKSPSGDDVFLLHHMKKNGKEIVTVNEKESIVTTAAPQTLAEFVNQRARWASKAGLYRDGATIYLSLLVTLTNLIFVISLVAFTRQDFSLIYFFVIALKIITDYSVIIAGVFFFNGKRSLIWLPFIQLLYPAYLSISLVRGAFRLYRWKGREY